MTNRRYVEISAEESFLRRTAFTTFAIGTSLLLDFFYQRMQNVMKANTFMLPLIMLLAVVLFFAVIAGFVSSLSIGAKIRKRSFLGFTYDDEYLNYVAKTASAISSYAIYFVLGLTYIATKEHLDTTWQISLSLNDYTKLALAIMSLAYASPIFFLLWKKDE